MVCNSRRHSGVGCEALIRGRRSGRSTGISRIAKPTARYCSVVIALRSLRTTCGQVTRSILFLLVLWGVEGRRFVSYFAFLLRIERWLYAFARYMGVGTGPPRVPQLDRGSSASGRDDVRSVVFARVREESIGVRG